MVTRSVLSFALFLAFAASAHAMGGWQYGSEFYVNARDACDATLARPNIITKIEYSKTGDSVYCWFKDPDVEGDAAVYTLVHWNIVPWNGKATTIYRGTTKELKATPSDGDFGPGVYWTVEEFHARSDAQARFLDAAGDAPFAEWKKLPSALVLETPFPSTLDDRTFNFAVGKEREAFEGHVRATLAAPQVVRFFAGLQSPEAVTKAVEAWLKTKNKKLADFEMVIGPSYRVPESVQIRVKPGSSYIDLFNKQSKVRYEVREPTVHDIYTALMKAETSAKNGSCGSWGGIEGGKLFAQRGWRAAVYQALPPKGGNHRYLLMGDVIIDGAWWQFFNHLGTKGEHAPGGLFVGTRSDWLTMLRAQCALEGNCDPGDTAEALLDSWWNGTVMTGAEASTLKWRGAVASHTKDL